MVPADIPLSVKHSAAAHRLSQIGVLNLGFLVVGADPAQPYFTRAVMLTFGEGGRRTALLLKGGGSAPPYLAKLGVGDDR